MLLLLLLFLISSIILIAITLFTPYPAPLFALGIELVFFIVSLILFVTRIKKKKKVVRTFFFSLLHLVVFGLLVFLFLNITMRYREKGDSEAFYSGIRGVFSGKSKKQDHSGRENRPENTQKDSSGQVDDGSQEKTTDSPEADAESKPNKTEPGNNGVEDPF